MISLENKKSKCKRITLFSFTYDFDCIYGYVAFPPTTSLFSILKTFFFPVSCSLTLTSNNHLNFFKKNYIIL